MQVYTQTYYRENREGSCRSAREIVPLILDLVQPKSVVDIGCGVGTWLSVFKEWGVADILGVDGAWIDKNMLEIPKEQFLAFDLERPLHLDRQFELVVSLETAEHLPERYAETFVGSLVGLGPVILFSAAIPSQGGEGHVNEQWPDYWVTHFERKGYVAIDCIRKRIWQKESVEWWYAQNMLFFAERNCLSSHLCLAKEANLTHMSQLSIVHPRKYLEALAWIEGVQRAAQDIAGLTPAGGTFILVDEGAFGDLVSAGRRMMRFLEREGYYWGGPPDDATAIRELERLRRSGANFIVFGWPAFWWLDYYSGLHSYLRSRFQCMLQNDRLVVFNLQPSG